MYKVTYLVDARHGAKVEAIRTNTLEAAEGWALSLGPDFLDLTWEAIEDADYEPCI